MREFCAFIYREIQSSVFALFLFAALAVTRLTSFGIPRYDLLLILSVGMQTYLVVKGLETRRELAVICVFHGLGIGLEIYKVSHGSWQYPDSGLKISGVPLYSGFMYASVASYMMQAWRRFDLEIIRYPRGIFVAVAGIAIYLNFFLSRTFGDIRWWIFGMVSLVFLRTQVRFTTLPDQRRSMPMLVAFAFIGLFVWFAEHLCTALGAWQYPYQREAWTLVDAGKLSSWILMVIISFIIVAHLKFATNGKSPSRSSGAQSFDPEPTTSGRR